MPVIYKRKERQNQVNSTGSYSSPESSSEDGEGKNVTHDISGLYQTLASGKYKIK